jgi:hypothetical protein
MLWKTCGRSVEGLCTICARRFFFRAMRTEIEGLHIVRAPSTVLSLEDLERAATILPIAEPAIGVSKPVKHRFEEHINGRAYLIEVSCVGINQWRAQIARTPGGSAALMPFYGKSPDEAAQHLSRWLSLLHGTPSPASAGDLRRI